jgi:hypothetical protein
VSYVIPKADLFIVNPSSTRDNPSPMGERLAATEISIPISFQTDEVQLISGGGVYTQFFGLEATELTFTLGTWSLDFIEAIVGRDDDGQMFAKYVTFLFSGFQQKVKEDKRIPLSILPSGRVSEFDFLNFEAGNAQTYEFTFILSQIAVKSDSRTITYELTGI